MKAFQKRLIGFSVALVMLLGMIATFAYAKSEDDYTYTISMERKTLGQGLYVESEDQTVNQRERRTCTLSIECTAIFNNLSQPEKDKLEVLPTDGIILKKQSVVFFEGESVYDVPCRICKDKNIHFEASFTPMYNSAYVDGIHNLYEFDCGELSGWMHQVNGWYPNYGCLRYQLAQGDDVQLRYTCDLGKDVGCTWMENS